MFNKTKLVVTIGPSSSSRVVIRKLLSSGIDVARINCSHASQREHAKVIKTIRSCAKELNRSVAILLDLQGPKIRTGKLKDGKPVELKKGNTVQITTGDITGTADVISTNYKNLAKDVKGGDPILIDDGLIELKVLSKVKDTVTCKVINGGILKEHKGINLPGVKVTVSSLTDKDRKDLIFGIKSGVDYFALSFVRSANDIKQIKNIIQKKKSDIPVIAKIEKPEAVDDFDEILEVADGIMVARGDLGVELPAEQIPTIQKQIIQKSVRANKPVITATQMLESMIEKPIPTRAEASDVANAVFDGTDAIMLSGETAVGKYPLRAAKMMEKITAEAERSPFMKYNLHYDKNPEDLIPHAIAQSCVNILHEVEAKAVVNFSWSGKTAKLISKQRPLKPVYVFTPFIEKYHQLSLIWGIYPLLIKPINDTKRLIEAGVKILIDKGYVKNDELIIIVTGLALKSGSTNLIKIHRVGQED